jgi:hypothetical protein
VIARCIRRRVGRLLSLLPLLPSQIIERLGDLCVEQGDLAAAEELLTRAAGMRERRPGPGGCQLVSALEALAKVFRFRVLGF